MAIDTVLNPAGIAQKLSIPQLQKAIQDGTIPPYIGIPVLQQKVSMQQRMKNAAAQPAGPSVAQQVMSQAQGLEQLQSNLPAEYAGGGIVAFAEGGELDDDDEEIEKEMSRAMSSIEALRERMAGLGADQVAMLDKNVAPQYVENLPDFAATEVKRGVTVKEGDRPAKTVEAKEKRVSRPAGIEELLAAIEQKESGGQRYDKTGALLTSPKGAMGEMQVMPGTARDPGFGITPARGDDPEELRRVGREYFTKMLEKYGDPKLAAIAYNMGPGATDKWLMAGADPARLPEETRKYAQGFAEGGITRLAGGDLITEEELTKRKEMLRRMRRMEQAKAAFAELPKPATPVAPAAPAIAAAPALGIGALGGAAATGLAGGILGGASDEGLEMLTGDIGSDTGLAAAILREGRKTEAAPTIATPTQVPAQVPAARQKPAPMRVAPAGMPVTPMTPQQIERAAEAQDPLGDLARMAAEQADIRQEDREAARPAVGKEKVEPTAMDKLRERIEKGHKKLQDQEATDNYLALLSAGLGMLSGTSPFGLSNIGKGGLQGIQTLMQSGASRAAQEKALLAAELGAERYGQYGELQKQQMEMRKELAEAERARKEEATRTGMESKTASLLERQRKTDEEMLGRIETQANKIVEASGKLASLENMGKPADEIARAKQRMVDDLLAQNPRYKALYKRLYPGVEESFGGASILSYDPKTKSLIR